MAITAGSKAGIRSWFGKGLDVKGLSLGSTERQDAHQGVTANIPVTRCTENAVDLASDCSLQVRYSHTTGDKCEAGPVCTACVESCTGWCHDSGRLETRFPQG